MASLVQKGLAISKNALFGAFLKRGSKLLGKPFALAVTLGQVAIKLDNHTSNKNAVQQLIDFGHTLSRMIRAYANGAYRQIETSTIVAGLAVLLYVLSPIDLVLDAIPVLGFMDDLALVSWFSSKFQVEVARFQIWEQTISGASTVPTSVPATPDPSLPPVAELGHS